MEVTAYGPDGMACEINPHATKRSMNMPGVAFIEQYKEFRAPLKDMAKFEGKSIGYGRFNGECAAGVQWALRMNGVMIGLTRTWRPGRKVRGNHISPGTAIASFRDGAYRNDHAAIFISQDENGLTVYDQFNNPKKLWGQRVLRFETRRKNDRSNNGDFFYTIVTSG